MIHLKRVLLVLIFLISFSYVYGAGYNGNYTNLTLENNGWCANLEITYRVWNITDYENRDAIYDDLCKEDETPAEDRCSEFDYINGASVKIYDGPLDMMPVILDTTTDSKGEFKIRFDEANQYLIEISKSGNYNDIIDKIYISDCKYSDATKENYTAPEVETEEPDMFNVIFNYPISSVKIDLKDANTNISSNFSVKKVLDFDAENIEKLNNSVNTFKINAKNTTYANMDLTIKVDNMETGIVKVYKHSGTAWSETSFTKTQTEVIIKSASVGVYSVVLEPIPIEEEIQIQEEVTNNQTSQGTNSGVEETQTSEETILSENNTQNENSYLSNNLVMYSLIGGGVLIVIILFMFMFKGKNKTDYNYHDHRKNEIAGKVEKADKTGDEHKAEPVTPYTQVYQKTKDYVLKYKADYNKDQIYRALKDANIPVDIINRVIDEEM